MYVGKVSGKFMSPPLQVTGKLCLLQIISTHTRFIFPVCFFV